VPQDVADRQRVLLGDRLPLDVEQMLDVLETDTKDETELRPEGDIADEGDPLTVEVCETVPQDVADRQRVLLGDRLPLDVEQMLGEGETDTKEESVLHSEDDAEGDCVSLAVGVCETVPQDDADRQRVPLGDRLALDVEQMLGEVETEAEAETVSRPEGDSDGDSVSLAVEECEAVPQDDSDWERVPMGDMLPLDVV
jgi:hypothetical protein